VPGFYFEVLMPSLKKLIISAMLGALVLAWLPTQAVSEDGAGRTLVCLDPGHGGTDSGAAYNGVLEKVPNLDIALRVRPILQSMGYAVKLTREADATVSLQRRCDITNAARADIFVSIHNNAYMTTSEGTETFFYYNSAEGRKLAGQIHSEVVKRIKLPDRGVKQAGFYVLKHTDMTAALVEGCFLTNPKEAKLLKDAKFRQKIAEGIAAGIHSYLLDPGLFDEYVLIQNPHPEKTADLEIQYMRTDGVKEVYRQLVPPRARRTIHVDEYVRNTDVSVLVRSKNGVPVIAERAQYFDFDYGRGGTGAPGVTAPARVWYLAEGSTNWDFNTFVLIQNPSDSMNRVTVEFMGEDGSTTRKAYKLQAHSRFTLDCSTVAGFQNADFSVKVNSESPVVVERAMYINDHDGMLGGHDSPGFTAPGTRWYLAEGHTGDKIDTYVLLQNPNGAPARASVTYMLPRGAAKTVGYDLLPNSRKTIHVNRVPGLEDTDVSFMIASDRPILAERSMYFDYFGVGGGSNSTATDSPSRVWYLAEGYTGEGFDTYVLLMNPGGQAAAATLRFMPESGAARTYSLQIPARSRRTVKVNDVKGMSGLSFSTQVISDHSLVVERAKYYLLGEKSGGDDVMGAKAPAPEWYFAEGCTR
jgi:N-acetylmuramoyl-L-alanine amidase